MLQVTLIKDCIKRATTQLILKRACNLLAEPRKEGTSVCLFFFKRN